MKVFKNCQSLIKPNHLKHEHPAYSAIKSQDIVQLFLINLCRILNLISLENKGKSVEKKNCSLENQDNWEIPEVSNRFFSGNFFKLTFFFLF